jgi:N6-L-threonylcarbamoyladenine synthase
LRLQVPEKPSDQDKADLAASFQAAAVEALTNRVASGMRIFRTAYGDRTAAPVLVVAGGVAANRAIRASLERVAAKEGFGLELPPPSLCTDNAAMVAWAGVERLALGLIDTLVVSPLARWPLESLESGRPPANRPEEVRPVSSAPQCAT